MSYHVTVAPWSASPEPVELDVPRATYESLAAGASVEIGVRRGALGIPWVDEARAANPRSRAAPFTSNLQIGGKGALSPSRPCASPRPG
jgi:hypothetical protein